MPGDKNPLYSYFDIDTVKAGAANFEPSLSYPAISSGIRLPMVDTAPHIKNTTYIPDVVHQFRNSYQEKALDYAK